jgi:ribose transport system substrate-binding protein
MKFKRTMAMVMATAMMLGLAACGGGSSSGGSSAGGDDEVKIAYIVKAKSDAFWTSMEDGAESFAEEKGIHLEFQAPEKETDVEKQVQMVENAVIKGFDAIVLSAADSNSLAPAIKKANDANIPVILVNDTMSQAALDEVLTLRPMSASTSTRLHLWQASTLLRTSRMQRSSTSRVLQV